MVTVNNRHLGPHTDLEVDVYLMATRSKSDRFGGQVPAGEGELLA